MSSSYPPYFPPLMQSKQLSASGRPASRSFHTDIVQQQPPLPGRSGEKETSRSPHTDYNRVNHLNIGSPYSNRQHYEYIEQSDQRQNVLNDSNNRNDQWQPLNRPAVYRSTYKNSNLLNTNSNHKQARGTSMQPPPQQTKIFDSAHNNHSYGGRGYSGENRAFLPPLSDQNSQKKQELANFLKQQIEDKRRRNVEILEAEKKIDLDLLQFNSKKTYLNHIRAQPAGGRQRQPQPQYSMQVAQKQQQQQQQQQLHLTPSPVKGARANRIEEEKGRWKTSVKQQSDFFDEDLSLQGFDIQRHEDQRTDVRGSPPSQPQLMLSRISSTDSSSSSNSRVSSIYSSVKARQLEKNLKHRITVDMKKKGVDVFRNRSRTYHDQLNDHQKFESAYAAGAAAAVAHVAPQIWMNIWQQQLQQQQQQQQMMLNQESMNDYWVMQQISDNQQRISEMMSQMKNCSDKANKDAQQQFNDIHKMLASAGSSHLDSNQKELLI